MISMNYGKGKDGRKLSFFQTAMWLGRVGENRKYKNQARGESSGVAKLTKLHVKQIRAYETMPRKLADAVAKTYGISSRYVYYLRARKTWKHLKGVTNGK